jgi:hypothetical protein
MTAQEFTYWLQGFLEISNAKSINEEQLEIVRKHLALVFTNVTRVATTDSEAIRKLMQSRPGGDTLIC